MKINFIKKIFLFIFFNLIFCNISLANTFVYECNLNTKYKNGKDGKWKQKYIKFTISSPGAGKVKIFDHEINLYYTPEMFILSKNEDFIYAVSVDSFGGLESLTINKENKYTQMVFLDASGGSTLSFGYCK